MLYPDAHEPILEHQIPIEIVADSDRDCVSWHIHCRRPRIVTLPPHSRKLSRLDPARSTNGPLHPCQRRAPAYHARAPGENCRLAD